MVEHFPFIFALAPIVYLLFQSLVCVEAKALESGQKNSANGAKSSRLVMISLDGFRWDYMERTTTKSLHYIAANGVRATDGITASFITKTFPNHITLASGLWEESHGIVANHMYDPVLNQTFSAHNSSSLKDSAWFDVGAEPIWVTNQNQGGRSGVVMWIGGDARIKGKIPTENIPFDQSIKNETKMDYVVNWFKQSKEPFNLALVYFDQPDSYEHWFGPESDQVTRMIGGMDEVIGYLLDQLEKEGLLDETNIIVTSDHGFVSTPSENIINLDDIIDPTCYRLSEPSPVAAVWPNEGYFDEIYANLTKAAEANGHFKVSKKADLPEKFHFTNNRRIAPIQVLADLGYAFTTKTFHYYNRGDHGYNNQLKEMHPFFVAMGPAFKKNVTVDSFNNVDIYPLMCHILNLTPAPNNGTLDVVSKLLSDPPTRDGDEKSNTWIYVGATLLVTAVVSIVAFTIYYVVVKRRRAKHENLQ